MKYFTVAALAAVKASAQTSFLPFQGYSYGNLRNYYLKGLNENLSASQTNISMGGNNKSWVLDQADETTIDSAYWHDYLGGSLSFDVDVVDVGCQCAATIHLVKLTADGQCSWDRKDEGTTPACQRVELMEANPWTYNVAAYPCDNGVCEPSVTAQSATSYGPGPEYQIDSTKPYSVNTRFWANYYTDTGAWSLARIETHLTQDGRS
jgi:hypothetical protein